MGHVFFYLSFNIVYCIIIFFHTINQLPKFLIFIFVVSFILL